VEIIKFSALLIHLLHTPTALSGFVSIMTSRSVPGCDLAVSKMSDDTYFMPESEDGSRYRTSSVFESKPTRKM
jgi:hypothetical protein